MGRATWSMPISHGRCGRSKDLDVTNLCAKILTPFLSHPIIVWSWARRASLIVWLFLILIYITQLDKQLLWVKLTKVINLSYAKFSYESKLKLLFEGPGSIHDN